MMCLIVKNMKPFKSARLKKNIYSFDKTDIKNFKFPPYIEDVKDEELFTYIPKLVAKYQEFNYIGLYREDLEDLKHWNDYEILMLLRFFKNSWSIKIPNEKDFFPAFAFTYNIEPLKNLLDKITGQCYDKIEYDVSKKQLEESTTWSALEVTYFLHYFVITHLDYVEEE